MMDDTGEFSRDTSRHSATSYEPLRHTLTVHEVELQLSAAGVGRTPRTIQRLCDNRVFDAARLGGNNEWFIAPDSVPKVIADFRAHDDLRARRVATLRDTARHDANEKGLNDANDMTRHGATQRDMSVAQSLDNGTTTPHDTSRHDATDYDIYEHPYVKKLEDRVDKLETKYEAQVRRTEEIQIQSQEKILELQRMTTIGQSKQLGDFLLQAKEWLIPGAKPAESREVVDPPLP